ncbi:LD42289p, putative [Brugia malayi]|uniref:Bm3238 n=1 Tax=Brugia malayi TaxID=6279 RepID=A0A0H5S0Y0_BRUMA|nr:LD42289p, putative [Brugia malayi]CRZ21892.1 Bm3238 [Brugia malayi]VIO90832.1 LD42289p, putative [Brugia malayi]
MMVQSVQTEPVEEEKPKCGCKGVRFCAACKDTLRVKKLRLCEEYPFAKYKKYVYSSHHHIAIHDNSLPNRPSLADIHDVASRINKAENNFEDDLAVPGLYVVIDFLSEAEEVDLVNAIDKTDWVLSQSGRRKQDYGPRINFKHKKIKMDRFFGMPSYTDVILNRMNSISSDLFGSYHPFELCNLEYRDSRWSTIEMHYDDTWIWGERLICINLLTKSVLTYANDEKQLIIYVPLPSRTMVCMSDEIRYSWRHAVFPEHIRGRRIALTMREPSTAFKEGGELYEKFGRELTRLGNIRI